MGVETIRSVAGVIAVGCGTMSFVGSPCPACRLVRGGVTKRKTRLSWNTQPTVISILVDRAPRFRGHEAVRILARVWSCRPKPSPFCLFLRPRIMIPSTPDIVPRRNSSQPPRLEWGLENSHPAPHDPWSRGCNAMQSPLPFPPGPSPRGSCHAPVPLAHMYVRTCMYPSWLNKRPRGN